MIDTPGFQDTNFEDEKFLEELRTKFRKENVGIRAIFILINFNEPRFAPIIKKQIHLYCILFMIQDFWEHVAIVFTKAYYHFPKEKFDDMKKELESDNGIIIEMKDYIQQCAENINQNKKKDKNFKKIRISNSFPAFYIDSDLNSSENENSRTKEEINKLINWARKKNYLDLQYINKNKIDVNYLQSEKMEDLIEEEVKPLKNSEILKMYIKKYYAQYKKTTFHKEIVIIKESLPYKIEEIKEEEKVKENLVSSPDEKDYKLIHIQHIAVKSKIRITKNNKKSEWKNYKKISDKESSRILYTDKKEIKSTYEEELKDEKLEGNTTISIFYINKITKEFINDKMINENETKKIIYTKKITKKIISETTEKKLLNRTNMPDMKFCEDIVREEIITEFSNGKKPDKTTKEIKRKKRYFKTEKYEGEPQEEIDGFIVETVVKLYEREDETDETGKIIIKKGFEKEIGKRTIKRIEKVHFICTKSDTIMENTERYEYRNFERTIENTTAKDFRNAGLAVIGVGAALFSRIPYAGVASMAAGSIIGGVSHFFASKTIIVKQRRKITTVNKIRIIYKIFSDHSKQEDDRNIIDKNEIASEWEDYDN